VGVAGPCVSTGAGAGESVAAEAGAGVAVILGTALGVGVGVGGRVGGAVGGCGVGLGSGGVNVCTMVGTIAGYGVVRRGVGVGVGESVATTSGTDGLTATTDVLSCMWRHIIENPAPITSPRSTTATKMGKYGIPPSSALLCCVRRRRPPGVRDLIDSLHSLKSETQPRARRHAA
jgi:hypothetical protein